MHLIKTWTAATLGLISLALLITSLTCYRRRRILPGAYYLGAAVIQVLAAALVGCGLLLFYRGYPVQGMHLFYSLLVVAGAVLHQVFKPRTGIGQYYRNKPTAHALLNLFVIAVALRAFMSARP